MPDPTQRKGAALMSILPPTDSHGRTRPDPRIEAVENALKTRTIPPSPFGMPSGLGLSVSEILAIADQEDRRVGVAAESEAASLRAEVARLIDDLDNLQKRYDDLLWQYSAYVEGGDL